MSVSSLFRSNFEFIGMQVRPLRRYKGHQNTSKNFIRGGFGPQKAVVIGGSEVHSSAQENVLNSYR